MANDDIKPLLSDRDIDDIILTGSHRNAAGGIYATSVYAFAKEVAIAAIQADREIRAGHVALLKGSMAQAERENDELRAALAQAPAVPEGQRLVPVEPTEAMVLAGYEAMMEWDARTGDDLCIENVYAAMLAAAPTPPAATAASSDEEILACLRPLYDSDQAARMGAADDLRTVHTFLQRYGQAPAASAEPVELVEAVTKAILFEDSGSTADWRDNTNLGQAAIRAYATAVRAAIAPHRAEQVALMQQADKDGRAFNAQGHSQAIQAIDVCLASLAAPVADQAPQDERMETTSEHIARDIREGRFPQRSEPQRVQATEWGPMPDAGVEADAHVAVIEGDEAVRVLRWNSDVGAFSYPVGTRLYAAQAPAADGDALREAVKTAYGYLWHVNNEPGTPNRYTPERAAYEARKTLRGHLTKDERGEGINAARALMQRTSGGDHD